MNIGRHNRFVSLYHKPTSTTDPKYDNPLDPPNAWANIEPFEPTFSDDTRGQSSRVTIRYHPQVTIDTHLTYYDPNLRRTVTFFVKGTQNIGYGNTEMALFCEEVAP